MIILTIFLTSSLISATDVCNLVATGSKDKTILIYDQWSGLQIRKLEGHRDYIRGMAFTKDCTKIVSGGEDKTVKLWDISGGKEIRSYEGHTSYVTSIDTCGMFIASGSNDKTIKIWKEDETATPETHPVKDVKIEFDSY